ncbi:MAG: cupredoxin domain-containing protein [Patescibacteria group bacterium]
MNNKLILVALLVVVITAGAFMLFNNNAGNNSQTQDTQNQSLTPTQAQPAQGTDVTVTSSGFEPQTVTIKTGQRVVWTNKSGGAVSVNSASHPTHLKWPFLNLGNFDDGGSVSVVFEKTGKYTYHNHLNASQTGTVIVE